jgi:hypothetical protein
VSNTAYQVSGHAYQAGGAYQGDLVSVATDGYQRTFNSYQDSGAYWGVATLPIDECFRFDATGFTFDETGQTWDQTICPTTTQVIGQAGTGGGRRKPYQFTPFYPGRLQAEIELQARRAIVEPEPTAMQQALVKSLAKPAKPGKAAKYVNSDIIPPMPAEMVADLAKRIDAYDAAMDALQARVRREDDALAILLIAAEI